MPPVRTPINALQVSPNEFRVVTQENKILIFQRAPVVEFAIYTSYIDLIPQPGDRQTLSRLLRLPDAFSYRGAANRLKIPALAYYAACELAEGILIFGGSVGGVAQNRTFIYTSGCVTELLVEARPPPRIHASLTRVGEFAILVGGCDAGMVDGCHRALGDVWLFRDGEWRRLEIDIPPRALHCACEYAGNVVVSGGVRYDNGVEILRDILLLRFCDVHEKITHTQIRASESSSALYRRDRRMGLLFSPDFIQQHPNAAARHGVPGECIELRSTRPIVIECRASVMRSMAILPEVYGHSMIIFVDGRGVVLGGFDRTGRLNGNIWGFDAREFVFLPIK